MKLKNNNDARDWFLIGIISIIMIIISGIIAVVLNFTVKGNAEWYVPVKVISGGEE